MKKHFMHNGVVYTSDYKPCVITPKTLGEIVESDVAEEFYLKEELIPKWEYMKGYKKIPRVSKSGHEYLFVEGAIDFPDSLEKPSRTMLTNEATTQRTTHVIRDPQTHRLRFLTPVETERLQGFDDNWTNTEMPKRARYFCMGNALVVPMITRMGAILDEVFDKE